MWRDTVLVPNELGDFTSAPGNSSDIITIESPILITAFMIVPPGPGAREISFAPNAFLYQSIAWPAPWMARYGVTVRRPAGIPLEPVDAFRVVALFRFTFRAMEHSPSRERLGRLKPRGGRWAKRLRGRNRRTSRPSESIPSFHGAGWTDAWARTCPPLGSARALPPLRRSRAPNPPRWRNG